MNFLYDDIVHTLHDWCINSATDRRSYGKLENVVIANALQLEAARCRTIRSALYFGQNCTAHAQKLLLLGF